MQVRAFSLVGDSVLAQVQHSLHAALVHGCSQWGIGPELLRTECRRVWELPAGTVLPAWEGRGQSGNCELWLGWQPDAARHVGSALFAPERSFAGTTLAAPIAQGAARNAMADVVMALATVAGVGNIIGGVGALPASLLVRGSGAVLVQLHIGRSSLACLLNHALVRQLGMPATAALAPLPPVQLGPILRDVPVQLSVRVGRAEVGLHNLLHLAAGDLVRLDQPVDLPLRVEGPGSDHWFNAYLGTVDGTLAVELSRPD